MSKKDKDVSSDMISVIYDTRVNLIKQLKYRGFNTDGYDQFSINDVNSMMFSEKVQQLDLLLENPDTNKKILVKYYLARKINKDIIQDMVEDVFKFRLVLIAFCCVYWLCLVMFQMCLFVCCCVSGWRSETI